MTSHRSPVSLRVSELEDRANPSALVPLATDGSAPGISVEVPDTTAVAPPAILGPEVAAPLAAALAVPVPAATTDITPATNPVVADPNSPDAGLPTIVSTTRIGPDPAPVPNPIPPADRAAGGILAGLSAPVMETDAPAPAVNVVPNLPVGTTIGRTTVENLPPALGNLISVLATDPANPTANLPAALVAAQVAANTPPVQPETDNTFLGVLSSRDRLPVMYEPIILLPPGGSAGFPSLPTVRPGASESSPDGESGFNPPEANVGLGTGEGLTPFGKNARAG